METIIVTRHAGALQWLAARGIIGRVIDRATADDVRGNVVIGVLPLELAAEAETVRVIRFSSPDARQRLAETKGDIPFEEMGVLGAELVGFVVRREDEIAYATARALAELEQARITGDREGKGDPEAAHSDADESLLRLLTFVLRTDAIKEAFQRISKWYA